MSHPKIVLLDIETSPIMGYTWGTYDQNVLEVIEPSKIISCAWKWLDSDRIYVKAINDYKDYVPNVVEDKSLIKDVWEVLDAADVVIAHNGDSFDIKKLNARFIFHRMNAPSDYKTVDTLKSAKKYFRFDSNSLNALGSYLNEGLKLNNGGFSLWTRCMKGDVKAWDLMKEYNARDVELLERVYLRLRPFIANHPDLTLLNKSTGDLSCSSCLSKNVVKRGFLYTRTTRKQRFQCGDCGAWGSGHPERIKADDAGS